MFDFIEILMIASFLSLDDFTVYSIVLPKSLEKVIQRHFFKMLCNLNELDNSLISIKSL